MAGSRDFTAPFQSITAGTMTGTSVINSKVTNIAWRDNVGVQLIWTGTPNGTFAIQVSLDYDPVKDPTGDGSGSGTWTPISLSTAITATGSANNAYADLNQLSSPWIRVVYTNTSSTGVLNCWVASKGF